MRVNRAGPQRVLVAVEGIETRLTLAPGQNGTKKLLARYGERLVCVRYRYDAARKLRHKTVELIVETVPWAPNRRNQRRVPEDMVGVRIAFSETALRERIKAAGAIWRPRQRLWEVDWRTVRELGLQGRVVPEEPG
ncbi:MAG TPA: hypothetical protein VLC73_04045 [Burkholderiales bacterium]|nr:hypothetical protein [Burkholderiales bacterium]